MTTTTTAKAKTFTDNERMFLNLAADEYEGEGAALGGLFSDGPAFILARVLELVSQV